MQYRPFVNDTFSRNVSCTVPLSLIPLESKFHSRWSSSPVPGPSCLGWMATLSTCVETKLTFESPRFSLYRETGPDRTRS